MNNKFYVGPKVSSFEKYNEVGPITGVALIIDEENEYRVGDDSGVVLEMDCPYGTQVMANNILASVQGHTYKGFRASDAELDMSAELGDGVTVNGVYSMLAYRKLTFGPGHMSEIAAPGESELEHEYPYLSTTQREIQRKIAQTNSRITKTAEEIRLEVYNELDNLSASITVRLDSITSQVNGLNGQVSTISQKVDNITLSVSNGTSSSSISLSVGGVEVSSQTIRFTGDVVFASDLSSGNTVVSGDCITTGEISADYIRLGGQMEVYKSSGSNNMGGYIGYVTGRDFEGARTSGMGALSEDEAYQVVVTDAGARLTSPTAEILAAYHAWVKSNYNIYLNADGYILDSAGTAITSDRKQKGQINYSIDAYMGIFDRLQPCSFVYNGRSRRHLGFIAQDVESALLDEGISSNDFAALINDNGFYSLRYSEFIPMLVAKIKQLEAQIAAWKN